MAPDWSVGLLHALPFVGSPLNRWLNLNPVARPGARGVRPYNMIMRNLAHVFAIWLFLVLLLVSSCTHLPSLDPLKEDNAASLAFTATSLQNLLAYLTDEKSLPGVTAYFFVDAKGTRETHFLLYCLNCPREALRLTALHISALDAPLKGPLPENSVYLNISVLDSSAQVARFKLNARFANGVSVEEQYTFTRSNNGVFVDRHRVSWGEGVRQ